MRHELTQHLELLKHELPSLQATPSNRIPRTAIVQAAVEDVMQLKQTNQELTMQLQKYEDKYGPYSSPAPSLPHGYQDSATGSASTCSGHGQQLDFKVPALVYGKTDHHKDHGFAMRVKQPEELPESPFIRTKEGLKRAGTPHPYLSLGKEAAPSSELFDMRKRMKLAIPEHRSSFGSGLHNMPTEVLAPPYSQSAFASATGSREHCGFSTAQTSNTSGFQQSTFLAPHGSNTSGFQPSFLAQHSSNTSGFQQPSLLAQHNSTGFRQQSQFLTPRPQNTSATGFNHQPGFSTPQNTVQPSFGTPVTTTPPNRPIPAYEHSILTTPVSNVNSPSPLNPPSMPSPYYHQNVPPSPYINCNYYKK